MRGGEYAQGIVMMECKMRCRCKEPCPMRCVGTAMRENYTRIYDTVYTACKYGSCCVGCSSSGVGIDDDMFRLCLWPDIGEEAVDVRYVYAGEFGASVDTDGGRECWNDHLLGSVSPSVVLDVALRGEPGEREAVLGGDGLSGRVKKYWDGPVVTVALSFFSSTSPDALLPFSAIEESLEWLARAVCAALGFLPLRPQVMAYTNRRHSPMLTRRLKNMTSTATEKMTSETAPIATRGMGVTSRDSAKAIASPLQTRRVRER